MKPVNATAVEQSQALAAAEKTVDEVNAKWKAKYAGDEILSVRIPMSEWERRTGWDWALDEFQKYDLSEIQAAVIVKADETTATIYHVLIDKDHLKGDTVRMRLPEKKERALYQILLLSNWDG